MVHGAPRSGASDFLLTLRSGPRFADIGMSATGWLGPTAPANVAGMAILQHLRTGKRVVLRARTLIGRAPAADLLLDRAAVSGEHARVVWVDGAWSLRDLGSRNGTWVGDVRVEPGQDRALAQGALLHFAAQDDPWLLDDAGPPTVIARAVQGGEERTMAGGLLALPSDADPVATLYYQPASADAAESWVLELPDAALSVRDRDVVVVDGRAWQVFIPGAAAGTVDVRAHAEDALRFVVSRDEEHVELWLDQGPLRTSLGARSHNELLLVLARRRLADGDEAVSEQGWMYRDELCDALRVDLPQLNLLVFRARKVLDGTTATIGAGLIERRLTTGQLRIGVGRLSVEQA